MDWTNPTVSESAEEMEDDMLDLVVGFIARMCKRASSSPGETIPGFKVTDGKRSKRSGPDGEVQNSPAVITMDSPEWASDALLALEGTVQEAPKEACASLKDGVPAKGPPDVARAVGEAPLKIVVELLLSARLTNAHPRRLRGPGRLVLNSPIISMKWNSLRRERLS